MAVTISGPSASTATSRHFCRTGRGGRQDRRGVDRRLAALPPANGRKHEAYDLCVSARALMDISPRLDAAHLLLTAALALDPIYAEPHRWLAVNHFMGWLHWGEPIKSNRARSVGAGVQGRGLDPNDARCRWVLGYLLAYERRC